jgi:transposase
MYLHTLTLRPDDRAQLEAVRDHDSRPYVRERAAALVKIADGMAAYAVARTGLLKPRKPDTVYAWLRAYEVGGIDGLVMRPRGHRGRFP